MSCATFCSLHRFNDVSQSEDIFTLMTPFTSFVLPAHFDQLVAHLKSWKEESQNILIVFKFLKKYSFSKNVIQVLCKKKHSFSTLLWIFHQFLVTSFDSAKIAIHLFLLSLTRKTSWPNFTDSPYPNLNIKVVYFDSSRWEESKYI